LLARLDDAAPLPKQLRDLRAVTVLEHIANPEAIAILQGLAQGTAEARLTQESKASLERLRHFRQ
jgi:hypothetical protein